MSNQSVDIKLADYACRADAQAILGLLNHYAKDPMGGGEPLSQYVLDNLINRLAAMHGTFTVLAFHQGMAVGLINCFESFSTFKCLPIVNIHDVIVRKNFRGQQLSIKMLTLVEKIAKQKGSCKLTLEVLEGNHPARHIYEKFGFNAYQLDPDMGSALFWEKTI